MITCWRNDQFVCQKGTSPSHIFIMQCQMVAIVLLCRLAFGSSKQHQAWLLLGGWPAQVAFSLWTIVGSNGSIWSTLVLFALPMQKSICHLLLNYKASLVFYQKKKTIRKKGISGIMEISVQMVQLQLGSFQLSMSFVLSMESGKGFRKGKDYVESFFLVVIWYLRREKNDRCFENKTSSLESLL